MAFAEHPLRRRYSLELALGIAVAVIAAWLLLGRDSRARGPRARAASGVNAAAAEPIEIAEPALVPPVASSVVPPVREELHLSASNGTSATRAARERTEGVENAAAEPEAALEVPDVLEALDVLEVLDVLVLDASGMPAEGVPIRLEIETTPPSSGPRDARVNETDASGRTRIPLSWFATFRALPEHSPRNVLRASVPLEHGPSIDFGTTVPAPGLVTLRLPPAGRVRVSVSADDGTPVAGGATVYATVRASARNASAVNASVRDGVAQFPWIDLGTQLELRAVYDDQRARASSRARATLVGPRWDGETVETALVLGLEWPLVTFRVLDEHGRALAFANLRLRVDEDQRRSQDARCVADGEGRAELRLLGDHRSPYLRTLEFAMEWPTVRRARIVLPAELERDSATDLGAVVLHPSR